MDNIKDILIIGGGINGAGIACDAAGRDYSVTLCEQSDLASGTSSASTKLIHGGLRYLEHYEFSLVRKALKEREILLKKAPHLISPMQFIMPHHPSLRPAWLIRLGLFLYDHLGGRQTLPASHKVKLQTSEMGKPLLSQFTTGFSYYDCWTDDARLVVVNAVSAKNNGAEILTQTSFQSAKRKKDLWHVTLKDSTGEQITRHCKILINASGPWVELTQNKLNHQASKQLRLVKGSHIIVRNYFGNKQAFILQNRDKRIIFVIPYQQQFNLIGTTDIPYEGDPAKVAIEQNEKKYLCDSVNEYFRKKISPDDVIWAYSGVRPLMDNDSSSAAKITRDYSLELDEDLHLAPLLTIIGGKITTYRLLAEQALEKLRPYLPFWKPSWTASQPLPGGDIKNSDLHAFELEIQQNFPWLDDELRHRYIQLYGSLTYKLLDSAKTSTDLGKNLGENLYEREINYLVENEFAITAEDILWRRTKLGLRFNKELFSNLSGFLNKKSR